MSSDETPDVPAVSSTREAVREKAQQVQAKQARARVIKYTFFGLLIVAVLGGIGYGVYTAIDTTADAPSGYPEGMSADGVMITAVSALDGEVEVEMRGAAPSASPSESPSPSASPSVEAEVTAEGEAEDFSLAQSAVDIHIYVDYLSPGAGEFERTNARQLSGWIAEGAVSVTYHPVALLTAQSNGTKYSQRAAAAAACVATHAPQQFYAYNHELLVANQPDVDSDGWTDTELAELAIAVGAEEPRVVRTCIEEKHFITWAKEATTRALEGPLPGTDDLVLAAAPMVVINGQTYVGALDSPAEFSQFVLTVASDAYYASPAPSESATPSASPSPSPSGSPSSDD